MVVVSVDDLPLSKREKASLRRADLVNAAQILYTSPSENATIRQLFEPTHFEQIQETAAYAQAPTSLSVLEILEEAEAGNSVLCKKEESDFEDVVEGSGSVTSKRKSSTKDTHSVIVPGQFTLSTGDCAFDSLLGGGVRRGCLTEIVGESSSGKSQLGMQTAIFTAVGFLPSIEQVERRGSEEEDDLYEALSGRGIRPKSETGTVAILNSGGAAVGRMMTRRMVELSNSLVAERWNRHGEEADAKRVKKSPAIKQERPGLFRHDGMRSSLQEAQQMAKARLLDNVKLYSPKDYESLDHTLTYFVPALIDHIRLQGKAPLSLIVLDDLPTLLIEEGEATSQKEYTLRRSRIVCEIADRLKRLSRSTSSSLHSAVAIVVINQVVDAFAKNKGLFLPLLLPQRWHPSDTSDGPPPLSSAYQDGFFNGLLASADVRTLFEAREDMANGKDEEESISRVSSSTKMAALGYSWVNCINVRIMLTRTSRTIQRSRNERVTVRRAVSVINPFAKAGQGWDPHVEYVILGEGLKSLSTIGCNASDSDDEEAMWSSFDVELQPNDVSVLVDREEQFKHNIEDEDLWALGSDLGSDLEVL